MRKLMLVGLLLASVVGCRKASSTAVATPAPPPAPTPVATGGSGGAVQAVRGAVNRTVAINDLNQIRTFLDSASLASGKMPSAQETLEALQKEAPNIAKLVQDGSIILTGTKQREGIWAYTATPQSAAGEHIVLTSSGVDRMPAVTLQERLKGK